MYDFTWYEGNVSRQECTMRHCQSVGSMQWRELRFMEQISRTWKASVTGMEPRARA